MNRRVRPALVLIALVLGTVTLAAREVLIQAVPSEGRVLVSFTARDSWTLGTREVLQAGQDLYFDYTIELRRPGPAILFLLPDAVLARVRVSSSAKFDTLMRHYTVRRMREGRVVDSRRQDNEAAVRDWLTTFDQVTLDPITPLELNTEYYVHVSLSTRPRRSISLLSLLPFAGDENVGRRSFTNIR
jgi:uncharacterized protein DUF4390